MPRLFSPSRRALLLAAPALLGGAACAATAHQDASPAPPPPPCFTPAERDAARAYWSAPGRYIITPSPDGVNRVNITVAGSLWYWNFVRVCAAKKATDAPTVAGWQAWWNRRIAFDKAAVVAKTAVAPSAGTAPAPDLGATPDALVAAIGFPLPTLYEIVQPRRYTVTFAPGDHPAPIVYDDNLDYGKRPAYFAYYQHTNGVNRDGKTVKTATGADKARLDALFAAAARTPFERHVMQAVSEYEGGFESINTYDTGYISVGFLQFITAGDGRGSLAEVLTRYKTDDANGFQNDFRRFGIDVGTDATLVCVDATNGAELRGADAVRCVGEDKRLTAVFERAGTFVSDTQSGDGFRRAQIAVARAHYYPADDFVDAAGTVRVSDVFRSEAGFATLMDRKVNRGNLRDLPAVAARIMASRGVTDAREWWRFERSLTAAMKWRGDFLRDAGLTQPPVEPKRVGGAKP